MILLKRQRDEWSGASFKLGQYDFSGDNLDLSPLVYRLMGDSLNGQLPEGTLVEVTVSITPAQRG